MTKKEAKGHVALGVEGKGQVGKRLQNASAKVLASVGGKVGASFRSSVEKTTKYVASNINATSSNNRINWAIRPGVKSYLEGEVFHNGRKAIDACMISRPKKSLGQSIELHGIVRVNAADLDITNVRLLDEFGEPLHWNCLHPDVIAGANIPVVEKVGLNNNSIHSRLTKSIIRKFLVSHGLNPEGVLYAICAARR